MADTSFVSSFAAKRFSSQIFLSLDLPSSLTASAANLGANPNAQRILVDMEMKVVGVLKRLELERSVESMSVADGKKEAEPVVPTEA